MKKLSITLVLGFIAMASYAQDSYSEIVRSAIKTEKKALIAEVMNLSDNESGEFWKLYNEYDRKLDDLNTDYFKLIVEFAENYENMSADKASDILKRAANYTVAKAKLEKGYIKKFQKVLTPQQALRFYQAMNKIDIIIEAQLASEIPLLEKLD